MLLGLALNDTQNPIHSATLSPPIFPQNIQSPVLRRTITFHTIHHINFLRLKPEKFESANQFVFIDMVFKARNLDGYFFNFLHRSLSQQLLDSTNLFNTTKLHFFRP